VKRAILFAVALIGAGVALVAGNGASVKAAASTASLMATDRAFDAATAARGEDGFAWFIADDMTTIRENEDVVHGKPGFVEGWKKIFSTPGMSVRWQPEMARISDDGTMGYTVGAYQVLRKQDGAESQVGSGKYVTIWRRQADGAWKAVFDSGVHDTPPAAAKP
jgi:ketosteroid isomerase-like protein